MNTAVPRFLVMSSLIAMGCGALAQNTTRPEGSPSPAPTVRLPATAPATPPAGGESPAAAEFSTPTGLREGTVSAREAAGSLSTTNRPRTLGGAAARVAKPERKGAGGFFAAFANLFNPLAPADKPEAAAHPANHYDGQWNAGPLPRGFQDERYHEAQSTLVSGTLEPDPRKAKKRKP